MYSIIQIVQQEKHNAGIKKPEGYIKMLTVLFLDD